MSEERKIRIVHIAQSPGGVERYLRSLLKYSNREKYEIILIVSNQYKRKNYVNLVDAFENVDMIRSIDPKSDLNAIKAIRKLLKKYKPDIVYCHSSKAGALGRIANMGLKNKCVYNPHGWAFNMRGNKIKKLIYLSIEKVLAPFCSAIICISGAEKESALKYKICKEKKLKVIYNGIDFEEYNMDYHMDTRKLLEIPEDAFVVGMVGRLAEQKAPDVFVKAANRIKEKIPEAFFIIVGDGPEWDEIEQQIEDSGLKECFILSGWTRRPMEYIKIFDVALLLSRWEGFGLVLPEYMLAGKPIVATAVDAIPYIIEDGKNGVLVEKDNCKEVISAIMKIYQDDKLKKKLVSQGKKQVVNKYNVARVVKEHERHFEKMVE